PMLHLHFGNRLEDLLDAAADWLAAQPREVFTPATVVVPSAAMGHWVTLGLARRHGIAALIQTPLPGSLLGSLHQRLMPDQRLDPGFERGALGFRIFGQLASGAGVASQSPLADYLRATPDPLAHFHFARRLAACYDQALIYRPDQLLAWEAGEDTLWQAAVWRELAVEGSCHRAQALMALDHALATAPHHALPSHLVLFGLHTMPPPSLAVFARLAERIPVQWFVPTPCREYWGGLDAPAALARRAARSESVAYRAVGHPLLASLGRQGAEFIDALSDLPGQVSEHFIDPCETGRTDLLARLQSDLLNLRDPTTVPSQPLASDDGSVQVHCCAGPLREVEVLHDHLRDLFDRDPDLNPSDVVVMTPDIDRYTPYVEAVFGSRGGDLATPFRIADRSALQSEPAVAGFFAWLALPEARFTVNAVLDLLECPPIARRLEVGAADRDLLRAWAEKAAIHWGLDGTDKARFDLPPLSTHTWRRGLDRLLLGTVLPEDSQALYGDMAPVEAVEGALFPLLGRMAAWVDDLQADHARLAAPRTPAVWAEDLFAVLDGLFSAIPEEEGGLLRLRAAIQAVAADATIAACDLLIPQAVFLAALEERLSTSGVVGGFLAGGVQFCAMVPLRSLPFAVVCLLGMDHDALPRDGRPEEFDPFATPRRPGDRNLREDDAYLFLEAIVSARQVLYLSYNGRDAHDYSERPPSVLLDQLLDTLAASNHVHEPGDWRRLRVWEHPLHAFSAKNFQPDGPLFSYRSDLAHALSAPVTPAAPLNAAALLPGEAETVVDLAELLRFWRHPVRHLLCHRLDIALDLAQTALADEEALALDALSCWQIRTQMLAWMRLGMSREAMLAHLRAADQLLPGPWGELAGHDMASEVAALQNRLAPHLANRHERPLAVDLQVDGMRLVGQMNGVAATGLLHIRAGEWKADHTVEAWLDHLILNAVAPVGIAPRTVGIGRKGGVDWPPLSEAATHLIPWLHHYQKGLTQAPVPLLPEVLLALKPEQDAAAQQTAMQKAYRDCLVPATQSHRAADVYLSWLYGKTQPIDAHWREVAADLVRPIPLPKQGRP
ncbi:MAG: exodeoxyribonuclease V subunit gamma, partial [Candidatus Macondimonas sp.]